MELEGIMLSKISQKKKYKYQMGVSYRWNLEKPNKSLKKRQNQQDDHRSKAYSKEGGRRGVNTQKGTREYGDGS